MKFFKRLSITIILMTFLTIVAKDLQSQSTYEIVNVAYRFEGSKLLITYDIIKAEKGQTFEISLEVVTAAGEMIIPESVYGDVKKGVIPGRKRTIIWDTYSDDVALDDNFSVNILAKPSSRSEIVPDSIVKKYDFPRYNDFGIGLGLDNGGVLGVKYTYSPIKYLGLFGAAGLQFGGLGWQVGAKGYLISKTSKHGFRPNVKMMYGVNASIYVLNAEEYTELYHGFCIGPGIEMRFGRMKKKGLDVDINFPFRSDEFWDDWDQVKNDPRVEDAVDPTPFTLSIGFHMEF